jgi:hypothetical protein
LDLDIVYKCEEEVKYDSQVFWRMLLPLFEPGKTALGEAGLVFEGSEWESGFLEVPGSCRILINLVKHKDEDHNWAGGVSLA